MQSKLYRKKILLITGDDSLQDMITKYCKRILPEYKILSNAFHDYSRSQIKSEISKERFDLVILTNTCPAYWSFISDFPKIKASFPQIKTLIMNGADDTNYNNHLIELQEKRFNNESIMRMPFKFTDLVLKIKNILNLDKY